VKLSDLVPKQAIVADLQSDDRDGAIDELVDALKRAERMREEHREELMLALLKREAVASTALGHGVAIPHAKVKFVEDFCGALGISRNGIDFAAADGQDVHVIFLFLSPEHAISGHLQLMAHIAGIARNARFISLLRSARTVRELAQLIDDAEKIIFAPPEELP